MLSPYPNNFDIFSFSFVSVYHFVTLMNRICVLYSSLLLLVGKKYVETAFASSGCYNKNTTDWENKHLVLTFLEVEKSKIKAETDLVSSGDVLSGSQKAAVFFPCPHVTERARELTGVSFIGH